MQASTYHHRCLHGHYEVAAPAHLVYATIFSPQALINASETVVVLQAKREWLHVSGGRGKRKGKGGITLCLGPFLYDVRIDEGGVTLKSRQ